MSKRFRFPSVTLLGLVVIGVAGVLLSIGFRCVQVAPRQEALE